MEKEGSMSRPKTSTAFAKTLFKIDRCFCERITEAQKWCSRSSTYLLSSHIIFQRAIPRALYTTLIQHEWTCNVSSFFFSDGLSSGMLTTTPASRPLLQLRVYTCSRFELRFSTGFDTSISASSHYFHPYSFVEVTLIIQSHKFWHYSLIVSECLRILNLCA